MVVVYNGGHRFKEFELSPPSGLRFGLALAGYSGPSKETAGAHQSIDPCRWHYFVQYTCNYTPVAGIARTGSLATPTKSGNIQ